MLDPSAEPVSERNVLAIRAWNLLSNGMGGLDWQGFDRIVRHLSIDDEEWLIESLNAIRSHRPSEGPQFPKSDEPNMLGLTHADR